MGLSRLDKKLYSWASILEDSTREQAIRTARMPFIYPHVALMPDAHLGKGATVGSVIPTEGAIMPAAVGVDIGCGMDAVLTQHTRSSLLAAGAGGGLKLSDLREDIEKAIPLSAGGRNERYTPSALARVDDLDTLAQELSAEHGVAVNPDAHAAIWGAQLGTLGSDASSWGAQLGTLGSGNHFIEVSVDELDRVWLFLHSGSRGIGNRIAQHHIRVAQEMMRLWHIELPDPDLAYLVEGTEEFERYIAELRWAQEFARHNRAEMMDRVVGAVERFTDTDVERLETISCHHNYTEREHHFGRDVWVSRKGAIRAGRGELGLIPGSMGDRSYIVEGTGDERSLCSAPHGAGRQYSRSAARREFTFEQLDAAMEGIEYRKTDAFIDEIPAAYKPIDVVMRDAADLVTIRHELRQIVNVKGD